MMKDKGFTLIELMIVISIVGIIAAFSIGFFKNAKESVEKGTAPIIEALDNKAEELEKL